MKEKLESVIDEIIQDKTFKLEAVEAIKSMRDDCQSLEESRDKLRQDKDELERGQSTLRETVNALKSELAAWSARDADLLKREQEITNLEKSEAVAVGTSLMLGHCFDTVFRNTIFLESFNKNLPDQEGANGMTQYGRSESGTKVHTTEPESR